MRGSHTPFLGVEVLEPRRMLSTVGGLAVPRALEEMAARHGVRGARLPEVVRMKWEARGGTVGTGSAGVVEGGGVALAAALAAPGNLTATAGVNAISLAWVDQSDAESGFRIYRSADGVTFEMVGWTGANGTWYTDPGLTPGGTYSYYVTAYDATSESGPSNVASARVSSVSPPTGFAAALVTDRAVLLRWQDTTANETGYRVYRSTDGVQFALRASLGADTTLFEDGGVTAGTGYWYKVSAWHDGDEAFATGAVAVATKATVVPPGTFTTAEATISLVSRGTFRELVIEGTSGNDRITVSAAGGMLTIVANGMGTTYGAEFGDIVIRGGSGDDVITVAGSVGNATLVYGGDGNNVLKNLTTGKATIVSIGNGTNAVTGNGVNTAYWVNPWDSAYASLGELALGGVNVVGEFYQPWTTDVTSADYVPRELHGQNLRDPTDQTGSTRLDGSFFGTGPVMEDINQTSLGDCFFLSVLASVAHARPELLANMGVDLGDGTYAVRYYRNGVATYVRVDGELGTGPWNGLQNQMPGPSGDVWGCMFEKAYAYFAGGNTYGGIGWGYITQTYWDLGMETGGMWASSGETAVMNLVTARAASRTPMTVGTYGSITGGAPLIHSHSYTVLNAWRDGAGVMQVQLRNVWGIDGAGNDGVDDGIVVVSYDQFQANCIVIYYTV